MATYADRESIILGALSTSARVGVGGRDTLLDFRLVIRSRILLLIAPNGLR